MGNPDDFQIEDGVLIRYRGSDRDVTIPAGVIKIGADAFDMRKAIRSVSLPESVTEIEKAAFEGCIYLKSVSIPGSTVRIGIGAFRYCKSLQFVSISGSVACIGRDVFEGCVSLSLVFLPAGMVLTKGKVGKLFPDARPAIYFEQPIDGLNDTLAKSLCACGMMHELARGREVDPAIAEGYQSFITKSFTAFWKNVGELLKKDEETLMYIVSEGLVPKKQAADLATELTELGMTEAIATLLDCASGATASKLEL